MLKPKSSQLSFYGDRIYHRMKSLLETLRSKGLKELGMDPKKVPILKFL